MVYMSIIIRTGLSPWVPYLILNFLQRFSKVMESLPSTSESTERSNFVWVQLYLLTECRFKAWNMDIQMIQNSVRTDRKKSCLNSCLQHWKTLRIWEHIDFLWKILHRVLKNLISQWEFCETHSFQNNSCLCWACFASKLQLVPGKPSGEVQTSSTLFFHEYSGGSLFLW